MPVRPFFAYPNMYFNGMFQLWFRVQFFTFFPTAILSVPVQLDARFIAPNNIIKTVTPVVFACFDFLSVGNTLSLHKSIPTGDGCAKSLLMTHKRLQQQA